MEKGLDAEFICVVSMEKTRQIIVDNEQDFPDFKYYLKIIDVIDENISVMPDVSIESCKSLIEGISKTILNNLGEPYNDKGKNADSPSKLLRGVLEVFKLKTDIEIEMIQNTCGFVYRLSELRNERGDISHGKSVPKDQDSDHRLSELVGEITDAVVKYMLTVYFKTDWSDSEDIKYDDNIEFNQLLDSEHELEEVSYSRALFDQDFVAYEENLNNYLSNIEEE